MSDESLERIAAALERIAAALETPLATIGAQQIDRNKWKAYWARIDRELAPVRAQLDLDRRAALTPEPPR